MTQTIEHIAFEGLAADASEIMQHEPEINPLVFSEDEVIVTFLGRVARGRVTQMTANFMKPVNELVGDEEQRMIFRPNHGEIRLLPGSHALEIGQPAPWVILKSYIEAGAAQFDAQ